MWSDRKHPKCLESIRQGVKGCRMCMNGVWPGWDVNVNRVDDRTELATFSEWVETADTMTAEVVGRWVMDPKGIYELVPFDVVDGRIIVHERVIPQAVVWLEMLKLMK